MTAGAISGPDAGWTRIGEGVGVSAAGAAAMAGPGGGVDTGKCDTGTPDCWQQSFPNFSQAAFAALSPMGQTSSAQRGIPSSRTSAPIRETEERVRRQPGRLAMTPCYSRGAASANRLKGAAIFGASTPPAGPQSSPDAPKSQDSVLALQDYAPSTRDLGA